MKRVLWLVPPREAWLATTLAPRLESRLRSEGYILQAPPPPEARGIARLLAHYSLHLGNRGFLVHAFDRLSMVAGLGFRASWEKMIADKGLFNTGVSRCFIPGIRAVRWGNGEELPWPLRPETGGVASRGDMIGYDSGLADAGVDESVVWSLEIARQAAPDRLLALGEGVQRQGLERFARATGASGALGEWTCEQALASGRLKGLLLAHPTRRTTDLFARALASGVRVAWIVGKNGPGGLGPAWGRTIHWLDRPGLSRWILAPVGQGEMPGYDPGMYADAAELARKLARVYEGAMP